MTSRDNQTLLFFKDKSGKIYKKLNNGQIVKAELSEIKDYIKDNDIDQLNIPPAYKDFLRQLKQE